MEKLSPAEMLWYLHKLETREDKHPAAYIVSFARIQELELLGVMDERLQDESIRGRLFGRPILDDGECEDNYIYLLNAAALERLRETAGTLTINEALDYKQPFWATRRLLPPMRSFDNVDLERINPNMN